VVVYSPAARRQQIVDLRLAQRWLECLWMQIAVWLQKPQGIKFETALSDEEEGDKKSQKPQHRRGKNFKITTPNRVFQRRKMTVPPPPSGDTCKIRRLTAYTCTPTSS